MPDTTRLTTALADRYRIQRELGAGGMATVFLAEDIKHHRQVALKVLRPELAAVIGAERFLKEIETTANLQHPHILPLFDSGTVDGTVFYVMPYVEGESLRERIAREKQLPVADAVRITREVAAALDYAHRKGIVHRDIKPENILLHDGQALVADFGIALAASNTGGTRMTETGMSLGTPHYMSPEQAMGERALDARSDVYALGCVLYEMLTGEPPFTGPTAQAIVARVMTDQPRPIAQSRPTIPGHVEAAVMTALQKLPADRFATAAEFSAALASTGYTGSGAQVAATGTRPAIHSSRLAWGTAAAALVLAALATILMLTRPGAGDIPVIRSVVMLPADVELERPSVDITRDGSRLVVSVTRQGLPVLMQRRLDELEFTVVPGSEEGDFHYLSYDGRSAVVRKGGQAVKVSLEGGPPVSLGTQTWPGYWDRDGTIYHPKSYNSGLWRMDQEGSNRAELSRPDTSRGELGHWWPQRLPGGDQILFTAFATPLANTRIEVLSLGTGERTVLVEGAMFGRYLPTGHLLFSRGPVVFAQRMQLNPARVSGPVVPILEDVAYRGVEGSSGWSVSDHGTLAYIRESRWSVPTALTWLNRRGEVLDILPFEGRLEGPSISPDGRRLAYTRAHEPQEVWVADLERGTRTRVSEPGINTFAPRWSPRGDEVFYVTERPVFDIYRQTPDGSSPAIPLVVTPDDKPEFSVSPDGRTIVFEHRLPLRSQLWIQTLDPAAPPQLLLQVSGNLQYPAISPDGRWLAYASNESGTNEIYLVPFPATTGRRLQVSAEGGFEPRWTKGGRELVFRSGDAILVVPFAPETGTLGATERLFQVRIPATAQRTSAYDVTPDGSRFIVARREPGTEPRELVIVTNWFQVVREKVAAGRE